MKQITFCVACECDALEPCTDGSNYCLSCGKYNVSTIDLLVDTEFDENHQERTTEAWEKATNAEYYFEWGNEPAGAVSIWAYDDEGLYENLGFMPKESALKLGLVFHNPFP